MAKQLIKYVVNVIESEIGWGQKIDEVLEFDTEPEALSYVKTHNARNNLDYVPDIYWRADYVGPRIKD